MREQMLKMKLQHLTNMGNWETGKHVQYVQCAVYTHWESWQQKSTKSTKTAPILIFFYCTAVVLLTFVDFC